ncbi:TPA: hypothetical protein ACIU15_003844 [Yersinia enterocolitica]|uniref:hypothetical protein n=1 Tax=Yersinia enterocolitica TaxID=630 RepID=UPI0005E9AC02|nr:hypothetical protein [Yersinia enterocolitica]EKN4720284.1 hypothetical protein [Yersinia enterocolitica]EKN4732392.1 hypothetical protein [Yersinia enterocolitica]EKN5164331.1 hypothetical protein [Yersinia enterocolitica]EKN6054146.1 hypothetical protein [Yersinia enterocolitica]EKN6076408.1 hypothetical protein [Yersinia enterocolitica]
MHTINKYINEKRPVIDDGCDHGPAIMDRINQAARARLRVPYVPAPKLDKVAEPVIEHGAMVKIGNRISYGRRVMTGIYELQRLGRSPQRISVMLKMPLDRVEHILKADTPVRLELLNKVKAGPLPAEHDIMKRLAAESRT